MEEISILNDPQHFATVLPWHAYVEALQEALEKTGGLTWPLRGESMTPTLPSGCLIEVRPLNGPLRSGDIVVFPQETGLVAHRLVRRRGDVWITQGDARAWPDAPIPERLLVGRVAAAWADSRLIWCEEQQSPLIRLRWILHHHVSRFAHLPHRMKRKLVRLWQKRSPSLLLD